MTPTQIASAFVVIFFAYLAWSYVMWRDHVETIPHSKPSVLKRIALPGAIISLCVVVYIVVAWEATKLDLEARRP